ncbi:MAG: hypothetical protein PHV62_02500 [Sulfuricurvum sp.]|nr:hypothetical protein [Sulfuricurvum sp.]
MVAYKSNEMMSSTDVAKNFGAVLSKLSNHEVDKICVLRNNKPEAVVLSTLEYEHIKDLADMAEHIGLVELIRQRKTADKEKYISFEEIANKIGMKI